MVRITNECVWCETVFRISMSEAIFPFTARKYCHQNCKSAERIAIETAKEFGDFFLRKIKGETPGEVKTYNGYFEEMIAWPKWSPRGEEAKARQRLAEGLEHPTPAP